MRRQVKEYRSWMRRYRKEREGRLERRLGESPFLFNHPVNITDPGGSGVPIRPTPGLHSAAAEVPLFNPRSQESRP